MIFNTPLFTRTLKPALVLSALAPMFVASAAAAATIVATPGEQNTQSGENGCAATPCQGGHWLHYPELVQVALGADYMVMNNGDGGAVLGCDAATATVAGGNSFCKSGKYTASIAGPPNIAIIGPFGEHDQRIIAANGNEPMYGTQATFEGAYEGLVQDYLKLNAKVYMMTPIDVPWGGTPNLPSGKNIVKDYMLPAALKVAATHNLKVIDTYTAISGTQQLQTMYYGTDGQVTMAGQQKMADLVLAALKDNGGGGTGGGGGAGGTGGAAGAAGSGGALAGAGGAPAGGAATAGAAGTVASAGTASMAGSGGAPGGGSGPVGTSGTTTSAAGSAPITATAPSSDSGGCTLSGAARSGEGAGLLLLLAAFGALARRRQR